jgi:hypothetical protein
MGLIGDDIGYVIVNVIITALLSLAFKTPNQVYNLEMAKGFWLYHAEECLNGVIVRKVERAHLRPEPNR